MHMCADNLPSSSHSVSNLKALTRFCFISMQHTLSKRAPFPVWVLHDWDDDECIQILDKCKEAITKEKAGKVLIVEAVIEEETEDKLEDARLMLDMVMMAHTTNGKERTLKEWSYLRHKAGFNHFNIKCIQAVQSIIEAYP